MKKQDVIRHFGTATKTARALRISQAAVSKWPKLIPELKARQLDEITNGKLRFDPALYERQPVKQAS